MSSSGSSSGYRQSDTFRPKFPLDPFAAVSPDSRLSFRDPWFLRVDSLQAATASSPRLVIFILGAPSLKDLAPILQSGHLSRSLVILATHKSPDIPHITIPALRILRLSSPLAIEDSGAVSFVHVLEWAERVARLWRKIGGSGIVELSEEDDGHNHLSPPLILRAHSTPSSPPSSASNSPPSRPTSLLRVRQESGSVLVKSRHTMLPPVDPSQRPFDALINYLPENVSDKALLKQTILVTTISRPFLATSALPSYSSELGRPRRRSVFNSLANSTNSSRSSVSLPPTPEFESNDIALLPKAHLVHLLPAPSPAFIAKACTKLVDAVEPFLLHFTNPVAADMSPSEALDRVRPYILSAATFSSALESTSSSSGQSAETLEPEWGQWAIADVVLSGALDGTNAAARRRAWISSPADIMLVPALERRPTSPASAPPATNAFPSEAHAAPLSLRRLQKQRALPDVLSPVPAHALSGYPRRGSFGAAYRKSPLYGPAGMPTPPDSDESAEEGAWRVSEGDPTSSVVMPVGATVGITASATVSKAGTVRWRFWRKENR